MRFIKHVYDIDREHDTGKIGKENAMRILVDVQGITKKFKGRVVLSQLDLQIYEGELLYLKGINGSGKSTLMKIICGIMAPDAGTVSIADDVKLGALIENPGFIENESLLRNLRFLGDLTGSFDEARSKALAESLELDFYSDVKMGKYSVGMRQKAGIIQAMNERQNLIFLDEPMRGLDEAAEARFLELCLELHKNGVTLFIVSHDKPNLPFDRVFSIREGSLVEE